jgi:hypothetical protein
MCGNMWHERLTQAYRFGSSFSNYQIEALITFDLRTRPGTIQLYHLLEPVAMSLLSGKLPTR